MDININEFVERPNVKENLKMGREKLDDLIRFVNSDESNCNGSSDDAIIAKIATALEKNSRRSEEHECVNYIICATAIFRLVKQARIAPIKVNPEAN